MLIFLSHASRDSAAAAAVNSQLASLGHRTYLANHDQRAGERLSVKVEEALRSCDLMIALLTPAGFDSNYVQQEIGFARGQGKLVVPLVDPRAVRGDLGLLDGVEYITSIPTLRQPRWSASPGVSET
jgi:hypothetical protein